MTPWEALITIGAWILVGALVLLLAVIAFGCVVAAGIGVFRAIKPKARPDQLINDHK